VHFYVQGPSVERRGYPGGLDVADRLVTLVQMTLVDARAYPLFGFLFGYGIVQLTSRRTAIGLPVSTAIQLVQRRGSWMIAIGMAHGVLLWSGDIVGSYGLLALVMAGLLVTGSDRTLLVTGGIGAMATGLLLSTTGLDPSAEDTLQSITTDNALQAMGARAYEWLGIGATQAIAVFGAVAVGAWAARRRMLDEPERYRRLLGWVAATGIAGAVLGGLPFALLTTGMWVPAAVAAAGLHALGGYAGGAGYAALFGLLAIRLDRRGLGPITHALRSCGQRSLSCYLAQSVAFVALLPSWTLGLGEGAHVWQGALVGVGVWVVILVIADVTARAGMRGPAEVLLRRLTYGKEAMGRGHAERHPAA
jgi:uncharacterized membrane protein YeiB